MASCNASYFTKFNKIPKHFSPQNFTFENHLIVEVISFLINVIFFSFAEKGLNKNLFVITRNVNSVKPYFQMWEISRQYTVFFCFFFFLFSSFPGGVLRYKSLDTGLCCFIHKSLVSSLFYALLHGLGGGELAFWWEQVPFFPPRRDATQFSKYDFASVLLILFVSVSVVSFGWVLGCSFTP